MKIAQGKSLESFNPFKRKSEHTLKDHKLNRHIKLDNQKATSESNLFNGITFYLNGYMGTQISEIDLRKLIQTYGGQVSMTLALKKVTHMICTTLADAKREKLKGTSLNIVTPQWVLDSIANNRRVPEFNYRVLTGTNSLNLSS